MPCNVHPVTSKATLTRRILGEWPREFWVGPIPMFRAPLAGTIVVVLGEGRPAAQMRRPPPREWLSIGRDLFHSDPQPTKCRQKHFAVVLAISLDRLVDKYVG